MKYVDLMMNWNSFKKNYHGVIKLEYFGYIGFNEFNGIHQEWVRLKGWIKDDKE